MAAPFPIKLGSAAISSLIFEAGSRVTTSDSGIQSCSVKALCSDGANVFNNIPAAGVPFSSVFGNNYLPSTFLVDYTESGPEIEYLEGTIARVTFNFKRQDPTQTNARKIFVDSTINYKTALSPINYTLATGEPSAESEIGFPEPIVTVKYNSSTRPGIGSGSLSQLYALPGSSNATGFPPVPEIIVPLVFTLPAGVTVSYFDGDTFVSSTLVAPTVFTFNQIFRPNPAGWQLTRLKSDPVAAASFYDVEETWRNFYIYFEIQFVNALPTPP